MCLVWVSLGNRRVTPGFLNSSLHMKLFKQPEEHLMPFSVSQGGLWHEFDTQVLASESNRTGNTVHFNACIWDVEANVIPKIEEPLLWWKKRWGGRNVWELLLHLFHRRGCFLGQKKWKRCCLKPENAHMSLFINTNLKPKRQCALFLFFLHSYSFIFMLIHLISLVFWTLPNKVIWPVLGGIWFF